MAIPAPTESDLLKRIENIRRELLDLSARNRLISTPRGAARGRKIEVVGERSEEVFRLLVRERKALSFLPGSEEPEGAAVVGDEPPRARAARGGDGGGRDARPPARRPPAPDPADLGTPPGSAPLRLL